MEDRLRLLTLGAETPQLLSLDHRQKAYQLGQVEVEFERKAWKVGLLLHPLPHRPHLLRLRGEFLILQI